MWHELVADESAFFSSLIEIDGKLAEEIRRHGCSCGGRLDRADYPRKPRGVPAAWEDAFCRRISFCCARKGCRKRCTPPSVRFFGRRVYVAAVILTVCGRWLTARQAHVPRNTARRWRRFFRSTLAGSAFWQAACGRLMPPIEKSTLVASLLERFGGNRAAALLAALKFFCPVTQSAPQGMVM